MKTRWKILLGAVGLVCLMVLISVIHHFQLKAAVNRYKAELKAKGEPMELAQVIPPSVPAEKNGATFFLKAMALVNTNVDVLTSNPPSTMRGIIPGKAEVSWVQPEIRISYATNSWKEVEMALAQNKEAINLLVQITNFSLFDFNLQYKQRFEMRLTHLVLEKEASQKLSFSAVDHLRLGNAGAAANNIRTILALAKGTHDERTAISQLVRIAITQNGFAAIWELLQFQNLTEEQLAGLQADCSQLEFIQAAEFVLPVEREGCEATFVSWRNSNSELQRYFDLTKKAHENIGGSAEENSDADKSKIKIFLWRYWWSYADELRYLKGYEVLVKTLRLIETNRSFQSALSSQDSELERLGISKLESSFAALFSGKTDLHSMMSASIVTLSGFSRKIMRVEVARQTFVTAIALKRYQLKRGNYPADLKLLVPEFVSTVPRDPVDGQPLRYRLNADGTFLLYSIGENGVDDGGNPALGKNAKGFSFSWQNPYALDWVWPQPATEVEIEMYYDEQAKKSR